MQNQFVTEDFIAEEVILKGKKKYIVKGFVSTTDPDSDLEIVTEEAQDSMVAQMKESTITFDIGHDSWIDDNGDQLQRPKNQLPVAKVIKAERRKSPKNGVYVEAELNTNHPEFKTIWSSIKEGFLHAFSIAFYPLEAVKKVVKGMTHNFIKALNLINITLTGNPVNKSATFVPAMKAAMMKLKQEKGDNMPEEVEKPVEEPPKEEATVEDPKEEAPKEEVKEPEPEPEPETKEDATPEPDPAEASDTPLSAIKSIEEKYDKILKDMAELKAKMEKPVMKAKLEERPEPEPDKPTSVLSTL